MSEKKNNNDPFSELFKRDGAEYDIPYREADWLKLEKKLDLRDAKMAYRRKVAIITAAAFLIISFLGYFTYENYVNINQLNQVLEDQIATNDSAQDSNSSRENSTADHSQEGQANLTESSESNENIPTDLSDSRKTDEPDEPSTSLTNDLAAGLDDLDSEESGILACDSCLTSELSTQTITASLMQNVSDPVSGIAMIQFQMAATQKLPQFQFEGDEKAPNSGSGFSLSLMAAPDLSTIDGFSNFETPGYSVGLGVGYQINERMSVSTGMSRSVVRYQGTEGGYNPPDYLTRGVVPDRITGECILLDIPLTVKYNVLEFSRSRIFATAGVSSYIMLNEEYDFTYEDQYQEYNSYSYSGKTGTAHWMSNAGFSIGIEVDIHPNWSLRAEPQIKLPLRNVGISNVRLYSLGSFISLSYKL
ncbi:porin family protein [Rhodohalobacter sp. 8-1]|uniref:porin family protein n=1 Tax=Rhodohalobacter sp. 8-1 TaxID=3131972 RepID=UPI0030ED504E